MLLSGQPAWSLHRSLTKTWQTIDGDYEIRRCGQPWCRRTAGVMNEQRESAHPVLVAKLDPEGVLDGLGGGAVAAAGVAHQDQHVPRRLPLAASGDAGGGVRVGGLLGLGQRGGQAVVEGAAEGLVQLPPAAAQHGVAYGGGAPGRGHRDHHGGAGLRLGRTVGARRGRWRGVRSREERESFFHFGASSSCLLFLSAEESNA